MQIIIRIVFLYFTTLPVKSNSNADLMEVLIRNKMSLLRKGLQLMTGNRRTEQSVDFRSPPEKSRKHWTASYLVPTHIPPIYRPQSSVHFPSVQTSLLYYPQIVNRPSSMPTLNRPTEKTLHHTTLIDQPPPQEENSFYHPPSSNTSKNWRFLKYRPTTKPPFSLVITHNGSYSSCVCSDNDNQHENEHLHGQWCPRKNAH